MTGIALICSGLLLTAVPVDESDRGPKPDELLRIYEAARDKAGRDPSAHVQLALWCEAHGLTAERVHHLAMAVLSDPDHAVARALMGLVKDGDAWRKPNEVAERIAADPALRSSFEEYASRRARTPDTAEAHWKLALWCEERGLEPQARAHLTTVVRLDPSREAAWKRLGYKRVNGRWWTDEQLTRIREQAQLQKEGDRRWQPLLKTWKAWLDRDDKRDEAERLLASVDDP